MQDMCNSWLSFWRGGPRWKGFKFTTVAVGAGLLHCLIDHSKELSSHDSGSFKAFFILLNILAEVLMWGGVGYGADCGRSVVDVKDYWGTASGVTGALIHCFGDHLPNVLADNTLDTADKVFRMLGLSSADIAIFTAAGLSVDILRTVYHNAMRDESREPIAHTPAP